MTLTFRWKPISLVTVSLLIVGWAAIAGCSSPSGTSCDDTSDCFQDEHCQDGICVVGQNDQQTNGDAGNDTGGDPNGGEDADGGGDHNDTDGGSDNHEANGGEEHNGDNDVTENDNDVTENDIDGPECAQTSSFCPSPQHSSSALSDVHRFGESYLGCPGSTNDFESYDELTESFSLCDGNTHYYRAMFKTCTDSEGPFLVKTSFSGQTQCTSEHTDIEIDVLDSQTNIAMTCGDNFVNCNHLDDGSIETEVFMDTTFQSEIFEIRWRFIDAEHENMEFDYEVEFEVTDQF